MESERLKVWSLPLKFLTFIGCNPINEKIDRLTLCRIIFNSFVQLHNTFLLVLLACLSLQNMDIFGEIMTAISGMYQITAKYLIILITRKTCRKIVQEMMNFPADDEYEEKVKPIHVKNYKSFMLFTYTFGLCIVLYLSKPLLMSDRVLPVIWYSKHCDMQINLCFAYHYLFQITGATLLYITIIGFDGFLFVLLSVAYCELEKVKMGLMDLNMEESDRATMKQLAVIIKKHSNILDYINKINEVFSSVLMNQLAATLIGLCTGIYFLMLFQSEFAIVLRFIPYLLSIAAQVFLYSAAGEKISEQTASICVTAYDTNWYIKHKPQTTKGLSLMILRSHRVTEVSAGGMWTLNMKTFLSILQTGFSLFTFMKTVQSK